MKGVMSLLIILGMIWEEGISHPEYFVWIEGGTKKVMKHDPPRLLHEVSIKGARNEYEAFQLVITSYTRDMPLVNIEVTDLVSPEGKIIKKENISLFLEQYVYVANPSGRIGAPDYYPDPLPAFKPFSVKAYENQPIWFNLYIPKDATPGDYYGTITVSPHGCTPTQIPLRLTVWDFCLTDESHQETTFGGGGRTKEEERWYWFLVERRITPRPIPVPLTHPEAARYIEDPRVTTFQIPYSEDIEELRNTLQLVKEKGWLKKGFIYAFDEPTPEDYPKIIKIIKDIRGIEPEVRVIGTMLTKAPDPTLFGFINLWCPNLRPVNEQEENGYFLRDRQKLGEGVWWYTCTVPKNPFPTYLIDDEGISPRIMSWMQWLYHIEGTLYWATSNWGEMGNPWVDPLTYYPGWANGDGCLIYPGDRIGVPGLVSCIRLELIRQGNEDYEYLWLLKERMKDVMRALGIKPDEFDPHSRGEDFCRAIIKDLTHFDRSPERLYEIRERVAEEILTIEQRPLVLVKMEPPDNQRTIFTDIAIVKGVIEKGTEVTVNGIRQKVNGNAFQTEIPLKKGENRIEIIAKLENNIKKLMRRIVVEKDPLLNEWDRAIKEAEEEGISVSQNKVILKKILDSEIYTPSIKEIVKENIETLKRKLASLLLERAKVLKRKDVIFERLVRKAEGYFKERDYQRAINALRHAKKIEGNRECLITPLIYQQEKCLRLTNGILDIVVSKSGGRILKFLFEGTPMIEQQALVRTFSYAEWRRPLGGYEDAYEWLEYFSIKDWQLEVLENTPERAAIRASVEVIEPKRSFRLQREMSLSKGKPILEIHYHVTNLGDGELIYKWHLWVRPAIGFKIEGEGGDPEGDTFILPLKEAFKHKLFDPTLYCYQRYYGSHELTANYAGVFDPKEGVALMHKLDPKIKEILIYYDTRKASLGYAINPILKETSLKKGESLTFTNYLIGLSEVKSQIEAVERIKSY